jgi:hypothetical protein
VAAFIVVEAGYSAAFLFLAAIAAAGLVGFCAMMPETLRAKIRPPAVAAAPLSSPVS